MAKTVLSKIRKHPKIMMIVFLAIIAAFIMLVIIGFTMDSDETWRSPVSEPATQSR